MSLYRTGLTGPQVAKSLGVGTTMVYRTLNEHHIQRRKRDPRRLSDDKEREVVQRYENGEPSKNLAREFSITIDTVRNIARRNGARVRSVGGRTEKLTVQQEALLKQWHVEGLSESEIARRLSVGQTKLSRHAREIGLPHDDRTARGSRHGNWKGGHVHVGRYWAILLLPDDPMIVMAMSSGYVMEHRLVVARALGRTLRFDETVHHINGDTQDNRLENLQLRSGKHGNGQVIVCGDCGSSNLIHIPIAEKFDVNQ